jgi:hypothetical protein
VSFSIKPSVNVRRSSLKVLLIVDQSEPKVRLWRTCTGAEIIFFSVKKLYSSSCKVTPLQARCDPEGGYRYSSTLP